MILIFERKSDRKWAEDEAGDQHTLVISLPTRPLQVHPYSTLGGHGMNLETEKGDNRSRAPRPQLSRCPSASTSRVFAFDIPLLTIAISLVKKSPVSWV
jgi:hypothetical protein